MLKTFAIALAGILGASGVAAAAAASHAGTPLLGSYSLIALTHAPVILLLAIIDLHRIFFLALAFLGGGATLFCADIATRSVLGHGLFPLSAPLGGIAMIIGWLLVAAGACVHRR